MSQANVTIRPAREDDVAAACALVRRSIGELCTADHHNIPAVVEAAKTSHVALEINNASFVNSRKGSEPNCLKIVSAVAEAGGIISLGTDSHSAFSLGNFTACQKIIDATGFPQSHILNVSPQRVLEFLEYHGAERIEEIYAALV